MDLENDQKAAYVGAALSRALGKPIHVTDAFGMPIPLEEIEAEIPSVDEARIRAAFSSFTPEDIRELVSEIEAILNFRKH